MTTITTNNAARQNFLPLLKALASAYQAFTCYDAAGYSDSHLTVAQADVIFTLGNTQGLTFKEIGEKTLITKGTLTGVIDRLENKKLVKRFQQLDDRRCILVALTAKGVTVFEKEFPRQIQYLKKCFDRISDAEIRDATQILEKIKNLF